MGIIAVVVVVGVVGGRDGRLGSFDRGIARMHGNHMYVLSI